MRHLANWLEKSSFDETFGFLSKIALKALSRVDCDDSKRIGALIKERNYLSICRYRLDYSRLTVREARQCRQALALFSKLESLPLGIDKEDVAWKKFQLAEKSCREMNELFDSMHSGGFYPLPLFGPILHRAQRKIATILGVLPSLESIRLRFGPGATTSTKKKNASVSEKLATSLQCSVDLVPLVDLLLKEMPHLRIGEPTVTLGKLGFVPKTASEYRTTVTEPPLNMMLQLGLGGYIRARIKRYTGIDLDHSQALNQEAAREGSITGELATEDLSSASDTISKGIVRELLPLDWYWLLSCARTSTVSYKKAELKLEKFSSMGNGFTFELETLIFYAIACAVAEGDEDQVLVYGDDIIIPSAHHELLGRVLRFCGFTVNEDKSFHTGPFRESCGADYLSGIDIRPAYVKNDISPADLFRLHNSFIRNGDEELAGLVIEEINPSLLIYGPDGYGDGHLVTTHGLESVLRPHGRKKGFSGYVFDTFISKSRRDYRLDRPGDRILPHYSIYMSSSEDELRFSLKPVKVPGNRVAHVGAIRIAPLSIPDNPDKPDYKTPSLPGTRGYKRISIYTLQGP